jgi:hypothetical protein
MITDAPSPSSSPSRGRGNLTFARAVQERGMRAKKFITPRSSVENDRKERSFSPSLSPAAGGEDKGEGAKGDLWRCA